MVISESRIDRLQLLPNSKRMYSLFDYAPTTTSLRLTMLTKYLTSVNAAFSPFNARSGKTVRNFLALLPPNARSTIAMDVKLFGRADAEKPARLALKFKDGKELELDLNKMKIRDIETEVDRHSRALRRKEELSGER